MSARNEDPNLIQWLRSLQAEVNRLKAGAGIKQNDIRLGNYIVYVDPLDGCLKSRHIDTGLIKSYCDCCDEPVLGCPISDSRPIVTQIVGVDFTSPGATFAATDGTWSGADPITLTYQWEYRLDGVGSWVPVSGGTTNTVMFNYTDPTHSVCLRCTVSAHADTCTTAVTISSDPICHQFDFLRYDYTGSVQTFTVPVGSTTIIVESFGASGSPSTFVASTPGKGGRVVASFTVTPLDVYDVYVGGRSLAALAGWPNGGEGGHSGAIYDAGGGGGSTHLVPNGSPVTDAIIVAPAGGGGAGYYGGLDEYGNGGYGGYLFGTDGTTSPASPPKQGTGASQVMGGTGSSPGTNGTSLQGGDGGAGGFLSYGGAGGGGGWYGGGGGAGEFTGSGGGGGGGSGYVDPSGTLIDSTDATNLGNGYMIISWSTV